MKTGISRLIVLNTGNTKVYAKKDADGYADGSFEFYSNYLSPRVELTAAEAAATVKVTLGPRAGILSGTLTEEQTGQQKTGTIRLWRVDNPANSISMSIDSSFHVLVPAGVSVGVEVTCNGHEARRPPGGTLNMKPGSWMDVRVALKHEPTPVEQ
jgi:hypothetical protein